MKTLAMIAVLLIGAKAWAFATHDMPKQADKPAVKVARVYGPKVKLDLSFNQCVEKGQPEYGNTLFYEEFDSLAECQKARERG